MGLDPIDGTRSFISGSPLYCTLIALLHKGKPRIGIIDLPALDERWSGCIADDLCGAWLQTKGEKKHCAVSDCAELQNAVLATTTLNVEPGKDNDALLKLYKSVGQVRLGGDASAFGCMASGFLDVAADYVMAPHDYLPLVPIVTAAGGIITDWDSAPLNHFEPARVGHKITVLAAATPSLHKQCLDALHG